MSVSLSSEHLHGVLDAIHPHRSRGLAESAAKRV